MDPTPDLEPLQGFDHELLAMSKIASILSDFSTDSQRRVVQWIVSKFAANTEVPPTPFQIAGGSQPNEIKEFPDVASLFVAVNPTTGAEKALVIAYWLQLQKGQEEWEGFSINTELKHLGHGLKNVTDALNSLIEQRPQLVVQVRKSGKSQQARKRYRLTIEGVKKIKQMIFANNAQ
jgi:hypothetical protein